MAKKKVTGPTINTALLSQIVMATKNNSFIFTSVADYTPLVAAGLVEINPDPAAKDAGGNTPTRATEAGIEMMTKLSEQVSKPVVGGAAATPAVSMFQLDSNVPVPAIKRGFGQRRESVYPFDAMAVGQSFFVPATPERDKPVTQLASTISGAIRKYELPVTNPDGSPKMISVMRGQRDANGDIVKDAAGKMMKVATQVQEMKRTRVFAIRAVEENGTKGARIWRTA